MDTTNTDVDLDYRLSLKDAALDLERWVAAGADGSNAFELDVLREALALWRKAHGGW
jgi:hypothetical protein